MAGPSSARDRADRDRSATHHHHRTISSTTLLLVLSLVLAVLAVMLSIPRSNTFSSPEAPNSGLWGYLTPRRSQVLVARESNVALREAEVARREAELLAGQPGGLTIAACEPCPTMTPMPPPLTVIREVEYTRDVEPSPPPAVPSPPEWWKQAGFRMDDILDRELRVSDREKDVGRREEQINRRESDASRRESWIMEQLLALEHEPRTVETEEVIYETRRPKPKELPPSPPPPISSATLRTTTITRTVLAHTPEPTPAHTRVAAPPSPEDFSTGSGARSKPQTQYIQIVEEVVSETAPEYAYTEPERETTTVLVREGPRRGWW